MKVQFAIRWVLLPREDDFKHLLNFCIGAEKNEGAICHSMGLLPREDDLNIFWIFALVPKRMKVQFAIRWVCCLEKTT